MSVSSSGPGGSGVTCSQFYSPEERRGGSGLNAEIKVQRNPQELLVGWSPGGRAERRQAWEIEHYESQIVCPDLGLTARPSQAAISGAVTSWPV